MRVKIVVSYNGTKYSGWQKQTNAISVQEVMEKAFFKLLNEEITLFASGRTDEGVHAYGQVCHFDTNSHFDVSKLFLAVNMILPKDIKVLSSEEVSQDFHARYGSKKKTYVYKMYYGRSSLPLEDGLRFWARGDNFDVEKVRTAVSYLVGEYDFVGFSSTGSSVKGTVRSIYSVNVVQCGNLVDIEICGSGFLYNMVRIIAGTLVEIAKGDKPPEIICDILTKKDRKLGGNTLNPCGLYLKSVEYNI